MGQSTGQVNRKIGVALLVVLVALALRVPAVTGLPTDFDEPVYLRVAGEYADAIRAGDWGGIVSNDSNLEHPVLVKLAYTAGLLALGPGATPAEGLLVARAISAACGSLATGALALVSPLAGLALAAHTMTVKYTSQAYLEAIPLLAVAVAMLAYRQSGGRRNRWFWLSAVALGVTAAGKYTYLVAGLALLPFLLFDLRPVGGEDTLAEPVGWRARLGRTALYVLIAGLVFVLLDPILWPNPPGRLWESLTFHLRYSQGSDVQRASFPWFQQWLFMSRPVPWHPGIFVLAPDGWIFLLALAGLPLLIRREPLTAAWLLTGWLWLTVWPTKWPQYTLVAVVPLCLSVATALRSVVGLAEERGLSWDRIKGWLPGRGFWLAVLAGAFILLGMNVFFGVQRALERRYWQVLNAQNTGLPADWVQAIAADPAGLVWLGTPAGLVRLDEDALEVLTAANSPLAHDDVRALLLAGDALWVGTRVGLQRFSAGRWETVVETDPVNDLALAPDGRLWAATAGGLLGVEGDSVTRFTAADGLPADNVLAVAVGQRDGAVWVATHQGAGMWDGAGWTVFTRENSDLSWSGVAAVAVDGEGTVWLGTLGGGLTVIQGDAWQPLTTANSGLPWNFVTTVVDDGRGRVWLAADLPAGSGGNLASFDYAACDGTPDQCPDAWQVFTPLNSGAPDSAVEAVATGADGRIWIGTRAAGVSIYSPPD